MVSDYFLRLRFQQKGSPEVEMFDKWTPLWQEARVEVNSVEHKFLDADAVLRGMPTWISALTQVGQTCASCRTFTNGGKR